MSWVRIDDKARGHRKVLSAGAEAAWLWVCGLMYANEQSARDGFIPREVVACLYPLRSHAKLARKLVQVGLWEEVEGGFQIHDYHDFQPTQATAEAISEARRAAGKRGGIRSGEARRDPAREAKPKQVASSKPEANAQQTDEAKTNPDPSRPMSDPTGGSDPRPVRLELSGDPDPATTEGPLTGLDRPELAAAEGLFAAWGPPQRGKVGRWQGFTAEQRERLRACGVTPEELGARFKRHHLSRGTFSECWQAEAENWVESEERRSRSRAPAEAPKPKPREKTPEEIARENAELEARRLRLHKQICGEEPTEPEPTPLAKTNGKRNGSSVMLGDVVNDVQAWIGY